METGKLNIDKLTTLNSNTCLSEWVEPGKEPSYEYCLRIETEKQREEERRLYIKREERARIAVKEEEAKKEKERIKLILIKREVEEVVTQYSICGGQRIITSQWKVKQG